MQKTPAAVKAEILKTLLEIDAFGARMWDNGQRARLIRAIFKLERGRMVTAVIGEFSAGKSTLINSLLGAEWLPMEIQPTTAVTCEISYGRETRARVVFVQDRSLTIPPEELSGFMNNTFNPENKKGVKTIYLTCPSELLESGVVLVDTPGTASIFARHEEITFSFLQRADACLLVLSMERPLTRDGLEFFRRIRRYMGKVFILLNKCDGYEPEEIEEQVGYVKRNIEKEVGAPVRVIPVSARLGLQARLHDDPQLLAASGLPALIEQLQEFFTSGARQVLISRAIFEALEILKDTAAALTQRQEALEVILNKEREQARARLKGMEAALEEKKKSGSDIQKHIEEIFGAARRALRLWLDKKADSIKLELEYAVWNNSLDWCRENLAETTNKLIGELVIELEEAVDRELGEAENKVGLKVAAVMDDIRGIKIGGKRPVFTGNNLAGTSEFAEEILAVTSGGEVKWGLVTAALAALSFFFPLAALAAGGSYLIGREETKEQKRKILRKIRSHLDANVKELLKQVDRHINLRERLLASQVAVQTQQTVDAMARALEGARRQLEEPPETIRKEIAAVEEQLAKTKFFLERLAEIEREYVKPEERH
ncbi:MAG: hypothetical protein PWR22_616 [Moorella sp. (in: firmicutes)]|nr:hypothetical protein [Moorella sp. (in: firmicutes)]